MFKALALLFVITAQDNTLCKQEVEQGFELLFNGKGVEHWRGYKNPEFPKSGWVVEEGSLRVVQGGGGGDIVTRETYADFELTFEFRVSAQANSGVMYRVSEDNDASYYTGPEYQVLDDSGYPDLENHHSTGSLYGIIEPPKTKPLRPLSEYNHGRIVVEGNHVQHWLNHTLVVDVMLGTKDWDSKVAATKFKAWSQFGKNPEGHIVLQDHGNDVWYRNVKVRRIEGKKGK